MLDVESQEGIIKAAVKPVVHSFMGTGTFTESQPCEEETDEPNDQSDEEEEETLSSPGRNDGRQLDCTDRRRGPQRDRGS